MDMIQIPVRIPKATEGRLVALVKAIGQGRHPDFPAGPFAKSDLVRHALHRFMADAESQLVEVGDGSA